MTEPTALADSPTIRPIVNWKVPITPPGSDSGYSGFAICQKTKPRAPGRKAEYTVRLFVSNETGPFAWPAGDVTSTDKDELWIVIDIPNKFTINTDFGVDPPGINGHVGGPVIVHGKP